METPASVNISEVIDNSRLGPFQVGICILCGLCLIMDGFDVQAMGYVAPAIIREWKKRLLYSGLKIRYNI